EKSLSLLGLLVPLVLIPLVLLIPLVPLVLILLVPLGPVLARSLVLRTEVFSNAFLDPNSLIERVSERKKTLKTAERIAEMKNSNKRPSVITNTRSTAAARQD